MSQTKNTWVVKIYPPGAKEALVFNGCTWVGYDGGSPFGFKTADGKNIETTLPWIYIPEETGTV